MNVQDIVAAAIYDFAAHLTCRKDSMTVGSRHDAAPMAEAVGKFLKLRDVDVRRDPPINTWQDDMRMMALEEQHRALHQPPADVRQHITFAINAHGLDSQLGMPDFVLADVALAAMRATSQSHRATRYWEAENTPERLMQKTLFRDPQAEVPEAAVANPMSAWPFPTAVGKVSDPNL